MKKTLTLILGGARSGKSSTAQRLAEESGETVLFVATATPGDEEMRERIAAHQAARSSSWRTLEAPLRVGQAVAASPPAGIVLVDCLTLLASNVLFSLPEPVAERDYLSAVDAEVEALVQAYRSGPAGWIVVSNEVGLGLVPDNYLGRIYRDALGRANQRFAQAADTVLFLVAGIPMRVKG
jgi:adenosylcobinamide kinase/adenosylcobinamide-phosphate guanylyltransferase